MSDPTDSPAFIDTTHDIDDALGVDSIQQGALNARLMSQMFGDDSEPPLQSTRFVLKDKLGSGGMGTVYSAYDPELERKVALKVLHPRFRRGASSEDNAERIRAEARAMARLNHAHVVYVHDVVEHEGAFFVAMELVDGGTLTEWLREYEPGWRRVVEVFRGAALGLHAAHEAGIVHRDFKPDNVLMTGQGVPKVTDFGLAQVSDSVRRQIGESIGPATGSDEVAVGELRGTPAYMAPELIRGGAGDARSDQFAFCVSLHQALYGELPFQAESVVDLLAAIVADRRQPRPARLLPKSLRAVVERGLSPRPSDRFSSMAELEAALARCVRSRLRRYGPLLVGALVSSGVAAGIVLGGGLREEPVDPCLEGKAQASRAWNDTKRARLVEHVGQQFPGYGPTSGTIAEQALDRWQESWTDAYVGLCSTRHELSGARYEVRMACLGQQRQRVEAVADLLTEADAELVGRIPSLMAELPVAEECVQAKSRLELEAPDPAVADQVAQLRGERAKIEAQQLTNSTAEASTQGADLRTRAEALGYRPLVAEIALVQGKTAREKDRAGLLLDAFSIGLEVGYVEVSLDAATRLIGREGASATEPNREDARERWNTVAEGLSARLGRPPTAELKRLITYARALRVHQRDARANEQLELAEALVEETIGFDDFNAAKVLRERAALHIAASEAQQALATLDRLDALLDESVGPEHPVRVRALFQRLSVLQMTGRSGQALALARRLEKILVEVRAPDNLQLRKARFIIASTLASRGDPAEARPRLEALLGGPLPDPDALDMRKVQVASSLCGTLFRLHEYEQATEVCHRALTAVERLSPRRPAPISATLHIHLGRIASAQGRPEDALPLFQRAMEIFAEQETPHPKMVAIASRGEAQSLLDLGRASEAVPVATQALERERNGPRLTFWGRAECTLGQVLWEADAQRRDEAIELVTSGVKRMANTGKQPRELKACREWLEAHR